MHRSTKPDASSDVYRDYFARGLELDAEAKAMRAKATALNKAAEHEGADPGALALARQLRRIPDLEKRRAKLRAYAQVLIDLEDEILAAGVGHNGPPVEEPVQEEAPDDAVPFDRRRTAAA